MISKKLFPELSDLLPYNHYCRKKLGYLYAIKKVLDELISERKYNDIIFVDDLIDNFYGCEDISNLKFYLFKMRLY